MRCLIALLCLLLAACPGGDSPLKVLTGGTLLDGRGQRIPDAVVLVSGTDIQAAGPASAVPIPADAKRIDVKSKFIVPGLIDVRVNLAPDAAKAREELHGFLLAGITSVGAENGGPTPDVMTARVLAPGPAAAGFADEVISSGGSTPGDTFRKIDRMAKAKIAPGQILTVATSNGAAWLKQERLGVLAAGRKADLLVLSADPSLDAANLRIIEKVMVDGKWAK